jgi:glycosyltransferase involved in cell wall biosynthesis
MGIFIVKQKIKVNEKPTISVITPTYNASSTLENALLCVANQRYRPIEHLIVDGLSTDDTKSLVKRYQKEFPHIRFDSRKDKGIYDAMNRGINMAKGDWIYFLGADDLLYNDTVFSDLYEEGHFGREEVIYGNVHVVGDTSWAKDGTLYDGRFDLAKLFKKNICHQAIFYPSSVIKKAGYFNKKYFISADWEYNIRCSATKEFTYVDKTIAKFMGGGTSTVGGTDDMGDDIPKIVMNYFNLDPKDESLHNPLSPFYPIVTRYKKVTWLSRLSRVFYKRISDKR